MKLFSVGLNDVRFIIWTYVMESIVNELIVFVNSMHYLLFVCNRETVYW